MRRAGLAAAMAAVLALAACETDGNDDDVAAGEDGQMVSPEPAPEGGTPAEDAQTPAPEVEEPAPAPEDFAVVGAPTNEIGAPVGFDPVVFEGEDSAVAVRGMTVHSDGAILHVAVRTHPDATDQEAGPGDDPMGLMQAGEQPEDGDDVLVMEVHYPDGRTAGTLDEPATDPADGDGQPQLRQSTSQGTPGAWDYELWLEPLPEAGDGALEVRVTWAAEGIDDRQELDMGAIADAGDRVVELWPEENAAP